MTIKNRFLLFWCIQLVSCQEKVNNKNVYEKGFLIQDTLFFYNQKQIGFGEPVEKFVSVMGKYDREVIDTSGGEINKDWMWNKKLIKVNKHSNHDYYTLQTLYYDKEKNEFYDDSNHKDYLKEYKSLEKVIKKYGKFDTYKEEKQPLEKH